MTSRRCECPPPRVRDEQADRLLAHVQRHRKCRRLSRRREGAARTLEHRLRPDDGSVHGGARAKRAERGAEQLDRDILVPLGRAAARGLAEPAVLE